MESLSVRKVVELRNLEELNLSPEVMDALRGYTINSLVLFTRRHELFNELVKAQEEELPPDCSEAELAKKTELCMKCEEEMENALEKAGFFRKDFGHYHLSFNILAFLRILVDGRYDDSFFDQYQNADREWRSFSNEEYESFDGLSSVQVYAFMAILKASLSEHQYRAICLRMGLNNGVCVDRKAVAEMYDVEEVEIFNLEKNIFHHMRGIINAGVLKRMFHNYVEPETAGLVKL